MQNISGNSMHVAPIPSCQLSVNSEFGTDDEAVSLA
jgi:hypothetical protein